MPITEAAQEHMRRVFTESFSVGDIAEALVSFDAETDAAAVLDVMQQNAFEVVGVRQGGRVAGYLQRDRLGEGPCGQFLEPFGPDDVIADSACLPTAVRRLDQSPRQFVTVLGRVGGIVTRSDLQKPPVRMWLFGMVTIIEMGLMRLIEQRFPDGGWTQYVSAGRLEKAEALLAERKRRNQELDLLDCLQFSDKGQITLRDELLREQVGYVSRNRGEQTIKSLEALRNNLAHSQDIVACDWDTIVALVDRLDVVFALRSAGREGG